MEQFYTRETLTLANFVVWQEPRTLMSGARREEALLALARITRIPADHIELIGRGEIPSSGRTAGRTPIA